MAAEVLTRSPLTAAALPLGTLISCTTSHGDVLRGNIIASDEATKALVIKTVSPSPTPQSSPSPLPLGSGDIHIINLHHVSEFNVSPQPLQNGLTPDPSALPPINIAKVKQRLNKNVQERWKEIKARGVNVSEEAQKLFDSLMKLYTDISWEGDVIVVMNDVRVSPPYTEDSCAGSTQLTAIIKKLVNRFNDDQKV